MLLCWVLITLDIYVIFSILEKTINICINSFVNGIDQQFVCRYRLYIYIYIYRSYIYIYIYVYTYIYIIDQC